MQDLLETLRRLRAPDGCPWDREQTHESLRPYLLEEAAEAVDAVSEGSAALAGELGDVLLQVAFHSVIAEEAGTFDYADVERGIVEKLVRRHPHVFGEVQVADAGEVVANWEAIKTAERGGRPRSAADRVPAALGALAREAQAQKLAGREKTGRAGVEAVLRDAPETAEGVAEVLAAVVAWARACGVDAEMALRERTHAALAALPDPEAGA
ncbi:MazG family protein [Deinococcus metallilatus]|uniref:MazG family protein n=1 Tax=Deinococcus metallilatus TaxID=1211322 RepID=A0AAJ5F5S8_9DEIO|nr:MazG family protein [Deinococcus metallilatus]MBB5295248.1 XTP/dITP diphosphohydrolase [Deinococcus metallilatus]QBY08591.1 MazG family protein [Deinococcus metallilatus]RXJ10853.1 MazG family protein [Deinococcus metallilatus]TLK22188.1 MazG family protein [Deinococcus metallilatus]GMA15022.1 nucleoside triphosphate pyrophosphohydrolase [Deinococcus metallilatus]